MKTILKKIFILPPLPTVLISIPSFALVIYVLATENDGPLAYIAYLASTYALTVSITGMPGIYSAVRRFAVNHPLVKKASTTPLGNKILTDENFRTEMSLYQGLFINLLYIVMKTAAGIYYRSTWFISIAVYYALLAVMRVLLLSGRKSVNSLTREARRCRLCGIVLLLMNQVLAGIVVFMIRQNRSFAYPGLLIYAMAAYSFYAVITAVMGIVKFRRQESLILSAAKMIHLVAAMVSLLSLETAMIARFGDGDSAFRQIMTGAAGGTVCAVVLGIAAYMIIRSTKLLRHSRA